MIERKISGCDLSFNNCINFIIKERFKRDIDKEPQSFRRITKAVANLIMTDTNVRNRLINAILEDDRRNNNVK